MAAGTELDRAVAERVLHLRIRDRDKCQTAPHCGGEMHEPYQSAEYDVCCRAMIAGYSQDWTAMGALVAHLTTTWRYVNIDWKRGKWVCVLSHGLYGPLENLPLQAIGESAPHAVALAALAIVKA